MVSLDRLQRIFLVGMSPTVIDTVIAPADQSDENIDNILVPGARMTNTLDEIPNTTVVMRLPARGRDLGFDIRSGFGKRHLWAR